MTNKANKPEIKVDIRFGPVTPAMKVLWRDWWAGVIASAQDELDKKEGDSHAK